MDLRCISLQVDIVCGDANQAWYFRSKTHKTERTDPLGNLQPDPLNGLVNTVARFEVSRVNKGRPLFERVCMEYMDNNADEITTCPESHYDMWDCCFVQLFSYGKQTDDRRATERALTRDAYDETSRKVWQRSS